MTVSAISNVEIRASLEAIPGLTLPTTLTNSELDATAARKQALVLTRLSRDSYPTGDQAALLVNNAVLSLCIIDVKRRLRPDDAQFLQALVMEEKLVLQDLQPVDTSGSGNVFLQVSNDG